MNSKIDHFFAIKDLPHIVALRERLEATREAAVGTVYPRRHVITQEARDAYDNASAEYFAAVDEAVDRMGEISQSIARAYAPA